MDLLMFDVVHETDGFFSELLPLDDSQLYSHIFLRCHLGITSIRSSVLAKPYISSCHFNFLSLLFVVPPLLLWCFHPLKYIYEVQHRVQFLDFLVIQFVLHHRRKKLCYF